MNISFIYHSSWKELYFEFPIAAGNTAEGGKNGNRQLFKPFIGKVCK